jgi:hypothetical protein
LQRGFNRASLRRVLDQSDAGANRANLKRATLHRAGEVPTCGPVNHSVTVVFPGPYPAGVFNNLAVDVTNVNLTTFNVGSHIWVNFDALWSSGAAYNPGVAYTALLLILNGIVVIGQTDPPTDFLAAPALDIGAASLNTKDPGPANNVHHVIQASYDSGKVNPGGAATQLALGLSSFNAGTDTLLSLSITLADGP